LESANFLHMA